VATDLGELRNKLWEAADQLRANSGLKASEYAAPVLGLIFLRYADERFAQAAEALAPTSARRPIGPDDYLAAGALYLPERSRFEMLLDLPEGADLGQALNRAMDGIEDCNPDLRGVLPRDYSRIPDHILAELLRLLRTLPEAIEGDWAPERLVVMEFDSVAQIKTWLASPEFTDLRQIRHRSATANVIVVEGV